MLPCNWRPITLCALLLASKVWPDNTPTNEDFCNIYPQFDNEGFNDLESMFITSIKWNVYGMRWSDSCRHINSSTYAKYYFALRAIGEKIDFRRRYNDIVHVRPGMSSSIEVSPREGIKCRNQRSKRVSSCYLVVCNLFVSGLFKKHDKTYQNN